MAMYPDSPDDSLQDEFDAAIFQNHALGRNILGTEETVSRFTQQDFFEFIGSRLDTHKIVFSVVGNISFAKVLKQVEHILRDILVQKRKFSRTPFQNYTPINK